MVQIPRSLVAALAAAALLVGAGGAARAAPAISAPPETGAPEAASAAAGEAQAAPGEQAPIRILRLQEALDLAERYSPGLRLAALQLQAARTARETTPESVPTLAPLASAFLQAQYGVTIPAEAITAGAAGQQATYAYEQAVAQYASARQQVRAAALQAYVEWQKALATVEAQRAALERTRTQLANVEAAVAVGSAAPYDLLQVQTALAAQEAALAGAEAMEQGARTALSQVIGVPLAAEVQPEPLDLRAGDVTLPDDLEALIAQAIRRRPDLRAAAAQLGSSRLQSGLATAGGTAAEVQAASHYSLTLARARTEIAQAYLAARGSLEELKAREKAVEMAREALRLAELRYDAGIATWVEVQSASAAALEAEAGRIQAAANLLLRLMELNHAVGNG
ncbi:MAG: TolC family protein [Symbiobacteriaceae bacterium]